MLTKETTRSGVQVAKHKSRSSLIPPNITVEIKNIFYSCDIHEVSLIYLTETITALLLLGSILVTAFDNNITDTFAQGLTSPLEEAEKLLSDIQSLKNNSGATDLANLSGPSDLAVNSSDFGLGVNSSDFGLGANSSDFGFGS